MTTDPTPEEIARVKRWASMQTPEVKIQDNGHDGFELNYEPFPLRIGLNHYYSDAAWSALAIALRPVFASIGPVIDAEWCCMSIHEVAAKRANHRGDKPEMTCEAY